MSALNNGQIADFVNIAKEAGKIALRDFKPGAKTTAQVSYKNGGSPVTSADMAVDAYLKDSCAEAFGNYAWFSEETADTSYRLGQDRLIIADPIDGTRAYAAGHLQWCVSIAMIESGRPVLGCLYAPALNELYVARLGMGATFNDEKLMLPSGLQDFDDRTQIPVFGPKPMVDWLNSSLDLNFDMQPKVPSLALRLANIATACNGSLALASENAHDWDIAAADLILCEAGGALLDFKGQKPVYNKSKPTHPSLFAASNSLAKSLLHRLSDLEAA